MSNRDHGARAGVYNGLTLRLYDAGVLGLTNRLIWRCPTPRQVEHYRANVGSSHLDIGPGTGYYLERIDSPTVTLLDLNTDCLDAAEARVGQDQKVHRLHQSFFDPIAPEASFDSIGLSFLLHCIPSSEKWTRLSQLRDHLRPGGRVFGSTVILDPSTASGLARALHWIYGRLGVFGNDTDTVHELEQALAGLEAVQIDRIGQVVLFAGTKPLEETP